MMVFFFLVPVLSAGNLWGETITINLTAEIVGIDDRDGLLEGRISVGDIITGSYTYDSDTPDTNPLSEVGDYWHASSPYGVILTTGEFVFQTDPENVNFVLEVGNNHLYSSWDHYLFRSYNNLALSNDVVVDLIDWQLYDDSGSVLSSDALPTIPPDLEHWHHYGARLHIALGYKSSSHISATVTSAVPEPATFLLFGLGALALLRKR